MISLGIDPSLTGFGWCVHNSEVLGEARIVDSGVISTPASEIFVSRYSRLRAALVHLIDRHPSIAGVGVESPPFGEQFSEGLYALFVYVNEALYLSRRNVVYFDPSTVKMLAKMDAKVRRGTMDKNDMIEAVKAETGQRLNHNIADAYIIARGAARFWELETGVIQREDLVPSELQAFHRVHTFKRGERAGKTVQGGLIFREDDRFFRFAAQPESPEEEELRLWQCRRGSKVLGKAESPPSRKKKARKQP